MENLIIREALEQDLLQVLDIYRVSGINDQEDFTVAEASQHLVLLKQYPSLRLFVAVIGEAIAGTYELLIMDNMAKRGRRSGIVEDVAVHPKFQGRGIGRAMMQHALDECRHAACYKLTLSSNLKREHAHRFYESLGFARHGFSYQIEVQP